MSKAGEVPWTARSEFRGKGEETPPARLLKEAAPPGHPDLPSVAAAASPSHRLMAKLSAPSASPAGSCCLLTFIFLSLISSLVAYPAHKGPSREKPANLSVCLTISAHLMREVDDSLLHFQETFNCTMGQILPINPNNEEKIRTACLGRKSSQPGFCMPEASDVVDQAWCMDTIYTILRHYKVEIKTFNSPKLLNTVHHMMQALKSDHKMSEQPASIQHPLKKMYGSDMKQCQILLILQQLSQTINRSLNYRKSLEM